MGASLSTDGPTGNAEPVEELDATVWAALAAAPRARSPRARSLSLSLSAAAFAGAKQ
jgi:hypothetical protein